MLRFLIVLILVAVGYHFWIEPLPLVRKVRQHQPGIRVATEPIQQAPNSGGWVRGKYSFTPLAGFMLRARVLSTERYRFDREAELSPVDFALGWQEMSDSGVTDRLAISQSNRWYHFRYGSTPPISPDLIPLKSANMHMIPGDEAIRKKLLQVAAGDVISVSGYLVSVQATDGWRWNSSLSRSDTGGGSCEVVWVSYIGIE